MTRKLLWEEYSSEISAAGKIPLQYSQFCNYFNRYLEVNKATMHFEHKVAEKIEVDWLCKDSHNQSYAKKIVMRSLSKIYPDNQ